MKIRAHRALLADAMKTVKEIEPTKEAVFDYLMNALGGGDDQFTSDLKAHLLKTHSPSDIEVKPYHYDSRIGWDTHIVTLKGNAVGFTDGPLKDL